MATFARQTPATAEGAIKMTQHVGFYQVISDNIVTLAQPTGDLDQNFSFKPPANAATDNPAILSFMVHITDAVNMKFRISLNGTNVVALNESGNFRSFVQEVVGGNLIQPGATNTLLCNIQSGSGSISFSDMVLWYNRNI
jgi:hypothetical protein